MEQERQDGEDAPEIVHDEPPADRDPGAAHGAGRADRETEEEERPEREDEDTREDDNVVWARKKYGEHPEKWARAAYDMEQHISRLTREKRESDELATTWYEYAQQIEATQQQQLGASMPLSSQEEEWIERSLLNPLEATRQAAYGGRVQLYNGVIERVASENPGLAASIGTPGADGDGPVLPGGAAAAAATDR